MLLKILKVEFKRNLYRWQVFLVFVLMVGFLIQGIEAFRPGGTTLSPDTHNFYLAFFYAQGAGPKALFPIVFPLFVALLAGDSLAWDQKTGYGQLMTIRTSYKKYILGKIVSVSLISFGFVFVTEILIFIYSMLTFPSPNSMNQIQGYVPTYATDLFIQYPYVYVLLIILNISFFSMAISLFSILISTKVKNIYVVLAVPFLIFVILQFIFPALLLRQYAPIYLVGAYLLSNFYYVTIEIPVIFIVLWGLLSLSAYIIYTHKYRVKGA